MAATRGGGSPARLSRSVGKSCRSRQRHVRAELHLNYSVGGIVTTVKVLRMSDQASAAALPGLDLIQLPARLSANDAVSGWLLFQVKEALIGGRAIDRYELVVRDVHDLEETVQVT